MFDELYQQTSRTTMATNAIQNTDNGDQESNHVIRVLLADDHALVREGTRRLLDAESDVEVVAEASNGEEAVDATAFLPRYYLMVFH